MGKFRVMIIGPLIALHGCAYVPRKVVINHCISIIGEVITAYRQKPKELNREKTKEEISDEITKGYATDWAKENDPKSEIINLD